MKNRLLILLIAFVFAGCGDAVGQSYRLVFEVTYMNASHTYSGELGKESQLVLNYCNAPRNYGQKYDVYNVYSTDIWGGKEFEDQIYVKHGESPSDLSQRFPYQGSGVAYIFGTDDPTVFGGVEFKSTQGREQKTTYFECSSSVLDIGNIVTDNSQKVNEFYNLCGTPLTNTIPVEVYLDRAWVVIGETYYNGFNDYYRLNDEDYWVKIDNNGYIIDRVNVNCDSGDQLICLSEITLPIASNSMTTVADALNIDTSVQFTLSEMGAVVGKPTPVQFPGDFTDFKSNLYAYVNGLITSTTSCGLTVPSSTQSPLLLWFESDKGIMGKMDFCGGGGNLYVELMSGTSTRFVTVDFCDPPFSDKGEARISLRIDENGTSSTRRNRIVIESDVFNMNIIITQLPGQ